LNFLNFPESGRSLGHVTPTMFGSTVGYPSDSLASCLFWVLLQAILSGPQNRSRQAGLQFLVHSSLYYEY